VILVRRESEAKMASTVKTVRRVSLGRRVIPDPPESKAKSVPVVHRASPADKDLRAIKVQRAILEKRARRENLGTLGQLAIRVQKGPRDNKGGRAILVPLVSVVSVAREEIEVMMAKKVRRESKATAASKAKGDYKVREVKAASAEKRASQVRRVKKGRTGY
jgi:hypothetical protein